VPSPLLSLGILLISTFSLPRERERTSFTPSRGEREALAGRESGERGGQNNEKASGSLLFLASGFFPDALALSVSPPLVLIYLPARHLRKWSLRDARGSLCACVELSNGSVSRSRETERERKAEEEKNLSSSFESKGKK
jgi:hypothetical protein